MFHIFILHITWRLFRTFTVSHYALIMLDLSSLTLFITLCSCVFAFLCYCRRLLFGAHVSEGLTFLDVLSTVYILVSLIISLVKLGLRSPHWNLWQTLADQLVTTFLLKKAFQPVHWCKICCRFQNQRCMTSIIVKIRGLNEHYAILHYLSFCRHRNIPWFTACVYLKLASGSKVMYHYAKASIILYLVKWYF